MKRVDNDSEMIVRRHNHGLELRSVKHSTILAVYQTHALTIKVRTSVLAWARKVCMMAEKVNNN